MFKQRIGSHNYIYKSNEFINHICIIALSGLIVFTPLYGLKKIAILLGSFVMWYLSTLTIDIQWVRRKQKALLYLLIFLLLDVFYSLSTGSTEPLHYYLVQKLFVYIWIFIFLFYIEHKNMLHIPITAILLMIAISCILTIRGNLLYPGASRRLASGGELANFYHKMYIAGYDIIYGMVFLVMPITLGIKKRVLRVIPASLLLIEMMVTLVIGSYAISILFTVGMLICALAGQKNKVKFFVITMGLTVLVLVFRIELLDALINIGIRINSYMLVRRATQLRDMTYFSDYGMNNYNRFALYLNGIMNFIRYPLVGRMGGYHNDILYAGHSGLINYFDVYGIFGAIYVGYWLYSYKSIKYAFEEKENVDYYKLFFMFVWAFLILETIDIAPATALVINFLAPAIFVFVEDSDNEINNNMQIKVVAK